MTAMTFRRLVKAEPDQSGISDWSAYFIAGNFNSNSCEVLTADIREILTAPGDTILTRAHIVLNPETSGVGIGWRFGLYGSGWPASYCHLLGSFTSLASWTGHTWEGRLNVDFWEEANSLNHIFAVTTHIGPAFTNDDMYLTLEFEKRYQPPTLDDSITAHPQSVSIDNINVWPWRR